jgi:multiple sugar transport system substrate-binding protein
MNKKFLIAVLPLLLLTSCVGGSTRLSAGENTTPAATTPEATTPEATTPEATTPEATTPEEYVPQITEDTEITLWSITGQNNQAQLQSYVDAFMRLEPKVKVNNIIQTGMGYNELKDAVVKGFPTNNYPDIVQCYPDHVAEYINYNKAVDLDPYINNETYGWSDFDKEDIIETFLDEGMEYTVEGTYSVPYCKSTEAMFYNADALVGLDLSSTKDGKDINGTGRLTKNYLDNLTWEDLFDKLCPALIEYNDSLPEGKKILLNDQDYHAVFAYDSDDNLFITLCEQYGLGYTSVDTATGKGDFNFYSDEESRNKIADLLVKWNEYARKGYIISKGSAGNNYTNEYFTKNNTLLSVGSTGGVKYQVSEKFNVNETKIPHAAGKDFKVINQGPSLTVLDHDDENRRLASWLLYKTITNEDNALDWALNSGYMGIRKSSVNSEVYQEAMDTDEQEEKTLDMLLAKNKQYTAQEDVLAGLYTSPAFVGSSTARTQVSGVMTKALTTTTVATKEMVLGWLEAAYNQCLLAQKA